MPNVPKVLFVAPSAYPLGGVAIWLDYLAKGLPSCGWNPIVGLVAGRWHDIERYTEGYPALTWVGIHNPTGSAEGRRRALAAAIHRTAPDVVVGVNIGDVYAACESLRWAGDRSFRVVMAIHGIAADLLGDLERGRRTINAVIATNRLTCRLCSELSGMEPDRVLYAPYGVDMDALAPGYAIRGSTGPLRITYVGRLDHAQKRVDGIPEIVRCLDQMAVDFRIEIVGDGPARGELSQALGPWLADGRAVMRGAIAPEDMVKCVYTQADALLVTSNWETGPIVIWEAMAAGVPVVTSRYIGSGLEGALKPGENCLMFPVGDAREAARQLGELTRAGVAERLVQGAHQLVAGRYSVKMSVQAWAQALDEIVAMDVRNADSSEAHPQSAGRMDRLFGVRFAEILRRCLGISFAHRSAGGEWPHSLSKTPSDAAFLDIAARLDRP